MRHGLRGLLLVGALVVPAGCWDGSSASPDPPEVTVMTTPPTPAPKPSPAPLPTDRAGELLVPPERPAAMDNNDEAGAQAAAEYLMEVSGYAIRSQELTEFTRLCDPESMYCTAVIDEVTEDVAAGIYTVGGTTSFTTLVVDPPVEHPFYIVWGSVDTSPFTVYDGSGVVIYESEGDVDLDFAVAAEHTATGAWLIRGAEAHVVRP